MLKLFAGQIRDELSQTVCLVKDPAIQCSNCLQADWRRIFANSLSRGGPRNSMLTMFAERQATNFRKHFVSRGTPQLMIKLFSGRLATNFRKQFVS
jgi:hypothetical protein